MNNEKRAAVKSGAVSSIPVAIALIANTLPIVLRLLESLMISNPALVALLVTLSVLTWLGMASVLGAIGGLVFVVSLNKLGIRYTFIKAMIPFVVL